MRRIPAIGCVVCGLLLLLSNRPAHAQVQVGGMLVIPADDALFNDDEDDATVKGNVRSAGGQMARALQRAIQEGIVPVSTGHVDGQVFRGVFGRGFFGADHQVNDPGLDYITTFDPSVVVTRPFEFSTQSETSMVAQGRHIVVGYNSSAGAVVEFIPGFGLAFTQVLFSGFSTSHDGGLTWTSGFIPPVSPDSPFTFGDPSLGQDRHGNIFYASLGTDEVGNSALIIGKSTDHGTSFGPATVIVRDDGADKEWLAIGPDPKVRSRDNLYVTWTSFTDAGSELHLATSIDGGGSWSTQTLFAPVDDGVNSAVIQFSNPVVDATNGRLYIPFLHFSDIDADNVRVLVSDDGGKHFSFLAFNVPGAPDAFAFPNVQPGVLNDCGTGGLRNALHQGPNVGNPRNIGIPNFGYAQATRLITQPAAAVSGGRLVIALNSSTSATFDDPNAGSEIRVLFSRNGGASWAPPLRVAASTAADPQHVHPSISLDFTGFIAHVGYYVQQANEKLRTDIATLVVVGSRLIPVHSEGLSDTSFDLTPSNISRPNAAQPFETTNYDRAIAHCYDIGEYMSVTSGDIGTVASWGDNRNTWTGPPGSAAPFTHAQPDVFFERTLF